MPIRVMGQGVSGWREYMKACKEEVLLSRSRRGGGGLTQDYIRMQEEEEEQEAKVCERERGQPRQ